MGTIQKAYCDAFARAEKHLKNAENFLKGLPCDVAESDATQNDTLNGVVIPAINELRYAGYHAAQALQCATEAEEKYTEAIKHCRRASYDAIDAVIQYGLARCHQFKDDYRLVVIGQVVQSYQEDSLMLDEIVDKIGEHKIKEDRWEEMESFLPCLQKIQRRWECGREELNKHLEERRSQRWHRTLGTFFAGVGVAVGVVSAAVAAMSFLCCRR